ncbi:unnamed protein product [Anisakis simplex]|uniref:Methyltransf_11 domain-containing protein n=1 Tax=Anisakis simplex TaxID=6269 RepID=A0A0M3JGC8_ANISI|nr:unnamed protein product [Anisakis simplex]
MAGFAKVSEWVDECFDEPSSSCSLSRTSLNASDQVGRLGGWQLNRRFQEQLHKIKYSESRELVVVESGLDWKLRGTLNLLFTCESLHHFPSDTYY